MKIKKSSHFPFISISRYDNGIKMHREYATSNRNSINFYISEKRGNEWNTAKKIIDMRICNRMLFQYAGIEFENVRVNMKNVGFNMEMVQLRMKMEGYENRYEMQVMTAIVDFSFICWEWLKFCLK